LELSDIYQPVQDGLDRVEENLKSVSKVEYSWLAELLGYGLKGGGKRLRPILVMLSGKFYDYQIERLLPQATAVELMHLATLVHDDTIDNSSMRWGRETINSLWGTETAVLLGDYLFAKAGQLTATTKNLRVIKRLSETLMIISSGEIAQAKGAFNPKQSHEQYMQRISSKTASLFSLSTESGAILSDAPEEAITSLREYGHNLGVAFQVVDDVLDFTGTEEEMGKPVGSDLSQGTLTLPAMLLIERFPDDNPVKKLSLDGDNEENIKLAIEMVRNSTIIHDCYDFASQYTDKAREYLKILPDNPSRKALDNLAEFIITRRR